MATEREIALEQALVVLLGSASNGGYNVHHLVTRATSMLSGNSKYRYVDKPYVKPAIREIFRAYAKAGTGESPS